MIIICLMQTCLENVGIVIGSVHSIVPWLWVLEFVLIEKKHNPNQQKYCESYENKTYVVINWNHPIKPPLSGLVLDLIWAVDALVCWSGGRGGR